MAKEKHVHIWDIIVREHQYNSTIPYFMVAKCECGRVLNEEEIKEILNKFYKG